MEAVVYTEAYAESLSFTTAAEEFARQVRLLEEAGWQNMIERKSEHLYYSGGMYTFYVKFRKLVTVDVALPHVP